MTLRDQLNLAPSTGGDLVCFSHLRWRWVYQRPQHLLTRAARDRRVFVIEEPVFGPGQPHMQREVMPGGVTVLRPCVPFETREAEVVHVQRALIDQWMSTEAIQPAILWYYTPQALPFTSHLRAPLTVYDCMDELSMFAGARPELKLLERQLLSRCDVVFTGGYSLYEAKRSMHPNVHAMPSSVEAAHFAQARKLSNDPSDQAHIPHPRIGYVGVLDERLDLDLIAGVAEARPDWHQVFVGPVTKISVLSLPKGPNLHYLGPRDYAQLPECLAAWDVASLPFALNDATRFISPTKTPEYLSAGLQVVSTPINDVIRMWGNTGLVRIGDGVQGYLNAIASALVDQDETRIGRIDRILVDNSWDSTWQRMQDVMSKAAERVA